MTGYTKGPWEVCNGTDVFTEIGAANADGVKADDNDGWQISDCSAGITFVEGLERTLRLSEMQANARLISAAPELYEALKAIREAQESFKTGFLHAPEMMECAIEQADQALAKAEGKQNE